MVAPGRLDLLWVTKPKVTVVQAAESITRKMTTMQGIVVEVVAPAGSCLRDTADQSKSSRHIPCAVHLESWQKLDCERHGGACPRLLSAMSLWLSAMSLWLIEAGASRTVYYARSPDGQS